MDRLCSVDTTRGAFFLVFKSEGVSRRNAMLAATHMPCGVGGS